MGTMYMFDGRVDVLQMSGKRLSVRSQVAGTYFSPAEFVGRVDAAVEETRRGARFIAKRLSEEGYEAAVLEPVVSVISGLLLIETVVTHEQPSDRVERLVLDTVVSSLVDEFNAKFNSLPVLHS